jgi:hypothetical protein
MLEDTATAKRATFGLKPAAKLASGATQPTAVRSPRVNGYLVSWMALAAFAFGYIGVAASRPDLLPGVVPDSGEQLAGGRSAGDIADEIASLRKWVNDLQHEMVAAKSTLKDNAEQHQALLQRMSQAEGRLGTPREIRADAALKAKALAEAQRVATKPAPVTPEAGEAKPVQVAAAAPPPTPVQPASAQPGDASVLTSSVAQGLKVINGGPAPEAQSSPVITGSIATVAAAAAAQVPSLPTPAPSARAAASAPVTQPPVIQAKVAASEAGPRGIEIAEAESLDGLRSRWSTLASRNGEALKSLQPRYRIASGGATETPFTLLAGPFANTADATRACAQLRTNGVKCRVSDFSGNGL